jgi:hypothetical protein
MRTHAGTQFLWTPNKLKPTLNLATKKRMGRSSYNFISDLCKGFFFLQNVTALDEASNTKAVKGGWGGNDRGENAAVK